MSSYKNLLLAVATLFMSSCGPIKGYAGPELPPDQLALVKNEGATSAFIDGTQFYSSGITVLPGNHHIETERVAKGEGYGCDSREEFDSYGYDSCRERREKDLRKGKDAETCYSSSYVTRYRGCTYPFTRYRCNSEVKLSANEQYTVVDRVGGDDPMQLFSNRGGSPKKIACKYDSDWTSYEESSY